MTNVADALADDLTNISIGTEVPEEVVSETNEIVLPFFIREQFRPVLIAYFEQTNKRTGAYDWAEEKTLDYFESQGIPRLAWNYRRRRSGT